jgi:NTP pyrophosphatase (non-canonical NTP hydrolase)
MSTEIIHGDLVRSLAKPGADILASLDHNEVHLLHMLLGLSGEVGELIDGIKKQVIYRQPLDGDNVLEELGDIEFYLEGIRQGLNLTRDEIVRANIAKLTIRYASQKYSDLAAQQRADKTP